MWPRTNSERTTPVKAVMIFKPMVVVRSLWRRDRGPILGRTAGLGATALMRSSWSWSGWSGPTRPDGPPAHPGRGPATAPGPTRIALPTGTRQGYGPGRGAGDLAGRHAPLRRW